jgi:hypothetical protein
VSSTDHPTWEAHIGIGHEDCFSLWRSVFQAGVSPPDRILAEDGRKFLDQIINNNAATYATELNAWSLEYYVENAVYRLRQSRELAMAAGIDAALLPEAHMFGGSDKEDKDYLLRSEAFTPYGEWEECFVATRALITTMAGGSRRIEALNPSAPCSSSASGAFASNLEWTRIPPEVLARGQGGRPAFAAADAARVRLMLIERQLSTISASKAVIPLTALHLQRDAEPIRSGFLGMGTPAVRWGDAGRRPLASFR